MKKIYAIIKEDLQDIARRFGNDRRTEISDEELGSYNMEDLITEETMVVTISHRGYVKRISATTYRAQNEEARGSPERKTKRRILSNTSSSLAPTPTFCSSQSRQGLLAESLRDSPTEPRKPWAGIGEFAESHTRRKDSRLRGGSRFQSARSFSDDGYQERGRQKDRTRSLQPPKKGGIIAIKLRDGDELVDVVIAKPDDQIVLATANGMAIRFPESHVRSMGRNTSGVKGISLQKGTKWSGWLSPTRTPLC